MAVPNELASVKSLRDREPQKWKDAHTGNAHTEDFIRQLAAELHIKDSKWGLMGKGGNPNDISDDVLCYFGEGVGHDPTHNNVSITGVDVIRAAGSSAAEPVWQVYNDPNDPAHTGPGAWVIPGAAVPIPNPPQPPQPPAPSFPYPDEGTQVRAYQQRVKAAYASVGRKFPDENDADAFRHFSRYGYDCAHMNEKESADKHIKELRGELGAPPE